METEAVPKIGDYQRAVEVLGLQEPYSDDDLNHAADVWEKQYGTPLLRPGEEDDAGMPNLAFQKRLKEFKANPDSPALIADPEVHRRELRKLLNIQRKRGTLTPREKIGIHENQKALGLALSDFSTTVKSPKEIVTEAKRKYAEIVKGSDSYKDRMVAVMTLTDVTTLQLFVEMDQSDDVREAAQRRIENLEVATVGT